MRTIKTKSFYFFLFFVIFLIPLVSFSTYVLAVDKPTISADLLAVTSGNFIDNTPNDGSGKFKVATGGSDLISFDNVGIVGYSEDRKTVLFGADVVFGFEMTAHTETTWMDIFPQASIDNWQFAYFNYLTYTSTVFLFKRFYTLVGNYHYRIYYDTIVGLDVEYKRHDYDGYIPITVTIDPGLKFGGDIVVGGETFSVPEIVPDVVKVIVVNYRTGEVGEYEDIFTQSTVDPDGEVTIEIISDNISDEAAPYAEHVNNADIGDINYGTYQEISIQSSATSGDQIGVEYPETSDSNVLTFDYQTHLQPEVYRIHQDNTINSGGLGWDLTTGSVIQTLFYPDMPWDRNLAVHVNNKYIHTDYIVKSYFVMTAEFDAALSTSVLNDPNLEFSDLIWDATVGVEKGKIVPPPPQPSWWEDILNWLILFIVLIAGLYIFIKIGIPYILRRQRRKNYNTRR